MSAMDVGAVKPPTIDSEEPTMQAVTPISLDIAKSVFQVHGIDAKGNVIIRRHANRELHRVRSVALFVDNGREETRPTLNPRLTWSA
jgi:hypothetical protein